MKAIDIVTALIMIALAAIMVYATAHLTYWDEYAPGAAFIVRWVAGVGAILGLVLLVQAIRAPTRAVDWPTGGGAMRGGGGVLAGIIALVAFIMVVPLFGTAITATAFMLVLLLVVQRQKLMASIITTVLTVGLIEVVFDIWLGVGFPRGILTGI